MTDIQFKLASPDAAADYIRVRGLTRENAASEQRLRELGVTAESWAEDIRSKELLGFVAYAGEDMVGYCFGAPKTGEVVVLALTAPFEGQGLGARLLDLVVQQLWLLGHQRLFLGCSSDPKVRSYGFYRHLGWRASGTVDGRGDDVLELFRR